MQFARWAHMRHFLSVCPSGLDQNSDWIIIHISASIIARSLKLYHSQVYIGSWPIGFYLLLTTLSEKILSANGHGFTAVTGRAHCQRQVAFL